MGCATPSIHAADASDSPNLHAISRRVSTNEGPVLTLRKPNQKIVVAVVYVCGMVMNSLDSTIVVVALATLGRQFNVTPAAIEGVVIGYLVSLAVFIPTSGWLGDRFGTKRIFLLALMIFTTASALCGLAGSLNQLILFRVLQGAGGGLLTPVGMAMLYRTFPPAERMGVARLLMFATIIGPASGPVLGGLLIEKLSWRWTFYVNVPVGLGALIFGFLFLNEHREPAPGRFDVPGFLLAAVGFGATMFALSEGPSARVVVSRNHHLRHHRCDRAVLLRSGRIAGTGTDGSASRAEQSTVPINTPGTVIRNGRIYRHTLSGAALPAGGAWRIPAVVRVDEFPRGDWCCHLKSDRGATLSTDRTTSLDGVRVGDRCNLDRLA